MKVQYAPIEAVAEDQRQLKNFVTAEVVKVYLASEVDGHIADLYDEAFALLQRAQDLLLATRKKHEAAQARIAVRKPTPRRGYAALPGTGPAGEACGSCRHHYRRQMAKTYHKCYLMRGKWTGGAGSDILVKSPACSRWERDADQSTPSPEAQS